MALGHTAGAGESARFARSVLLAVLTHLGVLGAAVVVAPRAADAGSHAVADEMVVEATVLAPPPPAPDPAPEPPHAVDPAPLVPTHPPADHDPYEPSREPAPVAEAQRILTTDDPSADTGTFASGDGNGSGMVAGSGRGQGRGGLGVGTARGTGTGSAPPRSPPPDLSRPARIIDVSSDNCAFPEDAGDVNAAVVTVQVTVGTDGMAAAVHVLRTPSRSFARAARQCARRRLYQPALDHDGRKVAAATGPLNVRFVR